MTNYQKTESKRRRRVLKTLTGIQGLDEITEGGLPKGRPTLLCGGAGSGKTLMAMEFIVKGITDFNENGVYLSFEESKDELCDNVASLGFDLDLLEKEKRIYIGEIDLQSQDIVELGDYDLEGLFSQISYAIDSVNAKRIVIDGIATLFSCFSRERIIRKELKRLFRWLKGRNLTAIITSEGSEGLTNITRHGIEEYISDCVITLDQRIVRQISTRRLRILKYRGSRHGTNEYPFLVTENGLSVLPITSMTLEHEASLERVPTGIEKLDEMFGGQGYYKGSSVLITGTAGTGKSSFAGSFARSVCESGNRCIYFSFEESANQIVRNMGAIGLDLKPFIDQNLLTIHAVRPTLQGLELHLLKIHNLIVQKKPSAVILDPVSNLAAVGNVMDIKLMFIRLLDILKMRNITALYTDLTEGGNFHEATEVGISSIMDSWIVLEQKAVEGQRERSLYIAKARGIGHSNQVRHFEIGNEGIEIGEPHRVTGNLRGNS